MAPAVRRALVPLLRGPGPPHALPVHPRGAHRELPQLLGHHREGKWLILYLVFFSFSCVCVCVSFLLLWDERHGRADAPVKGGAKMWVVRLLTHTITSNLLLLFPCAQAFMGDYSIVGGDGDRERCVRRSSVPV